MRDCKTHLPAVWVLYAIIALSLIVSGCKETTATKVGAVAPNVSCNDISGEYFNLSQLKGKVVVLYFWSSKCCGESVKQLEPFYQKQKYSGLSLVAVEVGGSKETVSAFVKSNSLTFTNLMDEYDTLSRSYRVIGFPTIFVIDKAGVIRQKVSGEFQAGQLANLVAPLL